MAVGIIGCYGIAYPDHSVAGFFACAPFLGFGAANFAVFTIWLPEQYPTAIRTTAFAFATTTSRWVAAVLTLAVAWRIDALGSLTIPMVLTAAPFLIGLPLVRLIPETRGQELPA
jgi:hypothetical protein